MLNKPVRWVMGVPLVLALATGLAVSSPVSVPVLDSAAHAAPSAHIGAAALMRLHKLTNIVPPAELAPHAASSPSTNGAVTGLLSYNWSGYADATTDQPVETCAGGDGCGTFSQVTASWVVPQAVCPSGPFRNEDQQSSNWIGVDGFNDGTVEQAGSASYCYEGQPGYYVWYELFPANTVEEGPSSCINNNIGCPRPGDHITTTITVTPGSAGNDNYTINLVDANSPANSFTSTQSCPVSVCFDNSAEWVEERPAFEPAPGLYTITPLTYFGTTGFTNAGLIANGQRSSISGYSGDVFDMDMIDASETYFLDCTDQREPVGSLMDIPTSATSPNPCPPALPSGDRYWPGPWQGRAGQGSSFEVSWDDSF